MRLLAFGFAFALAASPVAAQSPAIDGTVRTSVRRGSVDAAVCLRDVPVTNDSARFLLNAGLNIEHVRDAAGVALPVHTGGELHGVALLHSIALPRGADEFCVTYTGAFPVYDVAAGEHRLDDGSSVIAFNGSTMRARGESRWYPAPYDRASGRAHEWLRYRIEIVCSDCDRIYLNGSYPALGPRASFASEVPRELLLFAGDYPAQTVDGVAILGEAVAPDTARRFLELLGEVQTFYEEFLGIPFGAPFDILRIEPVRRDRIGQFWGFFADPALGMIGLPIPLFVELVGDSAHAARPLVLGAMAHELAHRWFAGQQLSQGAHMQLWSEPFAVYLAMKATRHFQGDAAYDAEVSALVERVASGPTLAPLDEAAPDELARDAYRYVYAPALLLTLEAHVGDVRMRALLRTLLTAPAAEQAAGDYALLRRSAARAGIDESVWSEWEMRCLAPVPINPCLRELTPAAPAGTP